MEEEIIEKLISKAKQASERAYCPYTETPVGACVLTQSGMIFTGCNIENVVLSDSLGALSVAVAKAISEGGNNIIAVALYCEKRMVYPTGTERQFLREFGERTTIICATKNSRNEFSIQELLPYAITNDDI